jgi:sugar lactone lactonase YvrE
LATVLGGVAVGQSHGLAVPPSLTLMLILTSLGVIDAFSGLVATVVFAVGVMVSGHFFSSHLVTGPAGTQGMLYAATGIFSMAVMWFIGPQLPRKLRAINLHSTKDATQRRYVTAGDLVIIPFLGALILGSIPVLIPMLTGATTQGLTQVTIQQSLDTIKWVVAIVMVVRVTVELFVHARFIELPKPEKSVRSTKGTWVVRVLTAAFALALIWEVMGWMWQTIAVWVIYLSMEAFASFGERFIRPSALLRVFPRNLFRILFLILLSQLAVRLLNGQLVDGAQILGWLAIILAIVIGLYAILEGVERQHSSQDSVSWVNRVIGIAVVIGLIIVSQGFVTLEGHPYSSPQAVNVSYKGILYIADSGNNRIIRVGLDDKRSVVGEGLANPSGVASDPLATSETVYVADTNHNRVLRMTTTPVAAMVPPSHFQMMAYAAGTQSQQTIGSGFSAPANVSVDALGRIFVADAGNNRVVEMGSDGHVIATIDGLSSPKSVFADLFGRLWVANTQAGTVLRFDVSAKGALTHRSTFATGLSRPSGVAVDDAGQIYVSNTGKNEILKFTATGSKTTVPGDFNYPTALSVDGGGRVIVANTKLGEVTVLSPVFTKQAFTPTFPGIALTSALAPNGDLYALKADGELLSLRGDKWQVFGSKNWSGFTSMTISALNNLYLANPTTGELADRSAVRLGERSGPERVL